MSVAPATTVGDTEIVMHGFSDIRRNSRHKSPQMTGGAPSRRHDDADKRQVYIRAIRVQVRGKDAYLGNLHLTVRPAAIFDDLAAPCFRPVLLQMMRERPNWIELLSAVRPVVLLTPDPAGRTMLLEGLGTWALALTIAPALHRAIFVHGFEVGFDWMAPEVAAALIVGMTTGMRSSSTTSAIAQAILAQLASAPPGDGMKSIRRLGHVASLVGVTRQAVWGRGHWRRSPSVPAIRSARRAVRPPFNHLGPGSA
jgi:hypothetical protein